MPFIKSLAFIYYILLAISISLNGEIISPYSHYTKKGLVYIAIIAFLVANLPLTLSVLKLILTPCVMCTWYLLINIYSNFVGVTNIFLAHPNC